MDAIWKFIKFCNSATMCTFLGINTNLFISFHYLQYHKATRVLQLFQIHATNKPDIVMTVVTVYSIIHTQHLMTIEKFCFVLLLVNIHGGAVTLRWIVRIWTKYNTRYSQ